MQELIERLQEQEQFISDNDHIEDRMWRNGMREAIKIAEEMLEKEKEVMIDFAKCCTSNGSLHEIDYVFNETFNTKEK